MSDRYEEIECYECGRLKTRLIWKGRCVTCTVQRLEFNLEENDTLRCENVLLRRDMSVLVEALEELVELMEDTRRGEYIPDSFTTQPARLALAAHKS